MTNWPDIFPERKVRAAKDHGLKFRSILGSSFSVMALVQISVVPKISLFKNEALGTK